MHIKRVRACSALHLSAAPARKLLRLELVCRQVDAIMRQAIKELPHMLVLHLKRFEWDFETETRFKKKDRFEFPLQLDMFRYTLEGLAEGEAAHSPSVCVYVTSRPRDMGSVMRQFRMRRRPWLMSSESRSAVSTHDHVCPSARHFASIVNLLSVHRDPNS